MMTPGSGPQIDGQWIDYYALLDLPQSGDEDTIRRRIGKVYADASANADHRNEVRRDYYRALVERVLPQCRRVLLDSEWRARYDHQHQLHLEKDGSAQSYIEFISSMRRESAPNLGETTLPQRELDEISAARAVVETAISGAELELIPSETVTNANAMAIATDTAQTFAKPEPVLETHLGAVPSFDISRETSAQQHAPQSTATPAKQSADNGSHGRRPLEIIAQVQPANFAAPIAPSAPVEETETAPLRTTTTRQPGEAARAQVITAQEAADIRRRRASNPDQSPFIGPGSRQTGARKAPRSRVTVETETTAQKRRLSPTSLNLMVAISGVLLTITIQKFASTPAVATSAGRTPIVLAASPEMQSALDNASAAWEKTPEGTGFDIVVQSVSSEVAIQRALGKSGVQLDGWIPANSSYAQRYNELAPAAKRPPLQVGDSLAQTPMVLVARADAAGALRSAFPNHKIGTWTALRGAVMQDAKNRFGLSDPRQSLTGAVARYSMAREWGESNGKSVDAALKEPAFWKWMKGFEENIPSGAVSSDAMVKDMVLGTTGRYGWAVAYESDALNWMAQGKPLELFYLPRTALADHPFCAIERIGAPLEVSTGRAAFLEYMRSEPAQKALLQSGFRPTEISLASDIEKNPFTAPNARGGGVQLRDLPPDERFDVAALDELQKQWSRRRD